MPIALTLWGKTEAQGETGPQDEGHREGGQRRHSVGTIGQNLQGQLEDFKASESYGTGSQSRLQRRVEGHQGYQGLNTL